MPHRLIAIIDSIVIGVVTFAVAVASELMSVETATGEIAELRQLLIPMLGALIATGGMIMFQIEREPRNIVLGRALFALLFGSAAMQLVAIFIPSVTEKLNRPIVMLISGAVSSMFFYAVIYFLVKALFKRSRGYADKILDQAERKAGLYVSPDTTLREIKTAAFVEGAAAGAKVEKETIKEVIKL